MNANNPRYPRPCAIYRMEGQTQFGKGERVTLYDGECRFERNTSIRNFKTDGVPSTDCRVSIPGSGYGILPGDMIDVAGYSGLVLLDSHESPFYGGKTEVFFNIPKN